MPLGFSKVGLIGGLAEAPYEGTNVSADLLFHYLILLQAKGFRLSDVEKVLLTRKH